MKKYLMTWYGMTDFRASLGLEQTTGPVLGALLAEDYTDVIILGFTHPDKSEHKADEFQQKTAEKQQKACFHLFFPPVVRVFHLLKTPNPAGSNCWAWSSV